MSDTDIYRRNHPDIPPRILFVGRTRLIQDADGLRVQSRIQVISALSRIETAFVKQYGPIPYRSDVSYLVIEQPISHLPFYLMTDAFQYLEAILKDVIDKNQDIIIAVNGWEGLTTDTLSFYGIFARRASHVTLCVYGSDPPSENNINAKFYRADVLQVRSDRMSLTPFYETKNPE